MGGLNFEGKIFSLIDPFLSKSKRLKRKISLLPAVPSKAGKTQGHLVPTLGATHNSNTLEKNVESKVVLYQMIQKP